MVVRVWLTIGLFGVASVAWGQGDGAGLDFFETKIRPVLAERCFSCHGESKQRGDVRLDRRDELIRDRDEGAIVDLRHPEKSRLMRAVRHQGEFAMPPKGDKLSAEVIADLEMWIRDKAPWQAEASVAKVDPRNHWAFRPVRNPEVPKVGDSEWVRNPVDAFILKKLEAKGIRPNPPADRRTLLRRLKFDLLGLPATFEEVRAFETDEAPDAYARLVDRYLASPHYGERWGRHWLDVARYADNKGYLFRDERRYPYSYTYRDYVVAAFNKDLPFDRFVREQIAADLLVERGEAEPASQAALGFLTLGRRFLNNAHDIIDDRIDVVTRGLLGLTVQCARCHDHKFDPISTRDYYSLYGVFANTVEPTTLPIIGEPEPSEAYRAYKAKLETLQAEEAKFREDFKEELAARRRDVRDKLRALTKAIEAHQADSPAAPPRAMVLNDAPTIAEPRVFLRGKPTNLGPSVPRQFLEIATPGARTPFRQGSGRLELADAIAHAGNPLTARVFVNRVWRHHFGKALVETPSDFGLRSDPPSHPNLLDHLASRFMDEGWSVKSLHRWIVLSNAYQLSSAHNAEAAAVDPENRLLARANRRRLDFEALRDSILAVAGTMDLKIGGRPVDIVQGESPRRTLYGFIDRQNLPGLFRTFDFASPDATSPGRFETTVPQQALFLLNSPFLASQAKALASRVDGPEKIRAIHRVVFAREPEPDEIARAESFLENASWTQYAQALLLTNEFVFVD